MAGNPIALVDPNGMEIIDADGRVTFNNINHDDAIAAFMLITRKTKNAYLDIEGNKGVRDKTKALDKTGFYGQWSVFSTANLQTGLNALSAIGKASCRR